MIKNKIFLILSLCTIFSSFGAQEQANETKHLRLAFGLQDYSYLNGSDFACWLPDGRSIITFPNFGGAIRLLDAKTGKLLVTTKAGDMYWQHSFSSDYRYVALLLADCIKIFDTNTGLCIRTIAEKMSVALMIWSPDNQHIVILGCRSNCRLYYMYDVQKDNLKKLDSNCFRKDVATGSWCPNGQFFATFDEKYVFLWDVQKQAPIRKFKHKVSIRSNVKPIHWSVDGLTFITISDDCAKLWNIQTGELIRTLNLSFDSSESDKASYIGGTPNNNQLLVISEKKTVRLCDVCTGDVVILGQHEPVMLLGQEEPDWSTQWSPDKKYLVTIGNAGARLWNIERGELVVAIESNRTNWYTTPVVGYSLSNDYFVVPNGKSLQLWDVHTGKLIQEESGATGWINWSPDGRHMLMQTYPACGGFLSEPEGIKVWDLV